MTSSTVERGRCGRMIAVIVALAMLSAAPPLRAVSDPGREYSVKAALIYNFARFTDWPAEAFAAADAPLTICVLAGDIPLEDFGVLHGRRVGERTVEVCYAADVRHIKDSHIVFVPGSARIRWPQLRAVLADVPVLTIGEMNGFLDSGGMMNLALADQRVEFEVNLTAIRRARLAVSARVLKLATNVMEEESE